MATTKNRALLRQIGTLFNLGTIGELTDGQLLERFARGDGEAAELAFGALIERHGAMVLRACRSQSLDVHDAHDAFQATFLILVEKAPGLWVRDSLGPWLHRVAMRTASCARASAIRRRRLELRAAEEKPTRDESPEDAERLRLLHEEIERLPERYRVPIILCDLEGRTCEEAARVLGRPVGTIKSWRARGRERLRHRLIRAGLAPSAAAVLATAPEVARAMPAAEQAARALACILSDRMAAGTVPASVSLLVKGVIRMMFHRQLRSALAAICAVGVAGGGFASVALVAADDPKGGPVAVVAVPDSTPPRPPQIFEQSKALHGEAWPMTLHDAIRIALDNNSGVVQVISFGAVGKSIGGYEPEGPPPARTVTKPDVARIKIARVDADASPSRFKAEVMAEVRSVEQTYWNLAAAHVQLWAASRAVLLADEVLERERAELSTGRGNAADVAEASRRLNQFNLDLATRTSEVIAAERWLRNILGLPPADNRRILPSTPAIETRREPDWDSCLAVMLKNHPDILEAREMLKTAEGLAWAPELNRAAEALQPKGAGRAGRSSEAGGPTDRAAPLVQRQKDFLQQVVHQTTHTLAQFFLEIDSNFKQFQKARRSRENTAQRMDVLRPDYEEGRISIDRFLDAVSEYTAAVGATAHCMASYNIAIVALEEAKGTLLESYAIDVNEGPRPRKAYIQARDMQHSPTPPAPSVPTPVAPIDTAPAPPTAAVPKPNAATTYSFHFTIGRGPVPMEIRGSITVAPARDEK